MNLLPFSNNWNNKLNCDAFTSIRLRDDIRFTPGSQHKVVQRNSKKEITQEHGVALVVYYKPISINDITTAMAYIDTGYSKFECQNIIRTMYKNRNVDLSKKTLCFIVLKKQK